MIPTKFLVQFKRFCEKVINDEEKNRKLNRANIISVQLAISGSKMSLFCRIREINSKILKEKYGSCSEIGACNLVKV